MPIRRAWLLQLLVACGALAAIVDTAGWRAAALPAVAAAAVALTGIRYSGAVAATVLVAAAAVVAGGS
jgi:hypothetical protein